MTQPGAFLVMDKRLRKLRIKFPEGWKDILGVFIQLKNRKRIAIRSSSSRYLLRFIHILNPLPHETDLYLPGPGHLLLFLQFHQLNVPERH
jgi:hypothetical protein